MRIRIVGAGAMGRGIAQWAAAGGHTVELCDVRPEAVTAAVDFVRSMLERAVQKGRMPAGDMAAALDRLVPLDDPWAPGPEVGLAIEAVREDLDTKAEVFGKLEEALPDSAVFATNTSSLSVTRIGASLRDPGRLAGLHFFNPVPLMRIVEVVPGAATRPGIPQVLTELVESCGHRAVTVADTPGFLVNHAGRGLVTEALALLEESVADPAGIDRIARDVLGLRMGPFELMDLTGLDVTAAVIDSIWQGFRHEDRLRPSYLTPNRVTAGLHGRKTGQGWFAYGPEAPAAAPEPPVTGDADRPVFVADGAYAQDAVALRAALTAAGATVGTGPAPTEGALVMVPVWGTTVAAAVASAGLPADRTFGVDPLAPAGRRRVLAVTPASDPAAARDARAVLARAADGEDAWPVSVVRDTAGSVAQRLLVSVVSVAASIAERSLAVPADIDLAVTTGLGYPAGPLAWGDRIGAARMLELQRSLHATTGDDRYRPTRWLTERAQLGLPLTAPGTSPADCA
ncbi:MULTISPECIES: 3-hydroxyacyl-CoA dehydrogenase [Streptomyces]|uniref:3-hydroxyacyl-CoA dehydrogenase n=1 Tax=Streptomyces silvae TaxID=2803812 RepID=A0ABU8AB75_9ACTN|nr:MULTISPECIES: 3-hydroxyacyl-CoA dehydrogenase [unclassified Streptomyces]MDX3326978.1 3-hydroxyacyl-CoA dehydrogenase [Streptomyces sp. ME02-6979-3A]MDX3683848.1 3-hydroxyacyl-CoA dehydrogenase [Streptomyces sp. AK04-4c]